MISDDGCTEFDRTMVAYWHSLEGMEQVRRVSLYIAKADELMAAWQPWNLSRRCASRQAIAAPDPCARPPRAATLRGSVESPAGYSAIA